MQKLWLVVVVAGAVALVGVLAMGFDRANVKAGHTADDVTIPIFSAWGGSSPNVDVTYQIKAGNGVPTDVVDAVQDAIDNWNDAIDEREPVGVGGWTFDLVSCTGSPPAKPDITITVKKGGAVLQGFAQPKFD